ncbi:hypothetical protein P167DRAFT_610180 [Morchella conica CCBAS932]|uniref:Secreted protein n=1 Tax=Morchella conica CCBAS932 TaxID=1392247 RepID=A0A3N4K7B2_9PEZI|nr:hypothetical protein P167DRAFT_610180 [Morchella conica CCBAS932]
MTTGSPLLGNSLKWVAVLCVGACVSADIATYPPYTIPKSSRRGQSIIGWNDKASLTEYEVGAPPEVWFGCGAKPPDATRAAGEGRSICERQRVFNLARRPSLPHSATTTIHPHRPQPPTPSRQSNLPTRHELRMRSSHYVPSGLRARR